MRHRESVSSNNSPCSTPRKSRKSNSKDIKNPYSTRGLDKFSALLAELEEKKQKIYAQDGAEDISLVRFAYSSANEVVPIVVKNKDHQNKAKDEIKRRPLSCNSAESLDKFRTDVSASTVVDKQVIDVRNIEEKKKKKKLQEVRRPCYYMPVFIILILVFLALFGRSLTIVCTSMGWYIVPALSSQRLSAKLAKKKQLMRRFSERSCKNFVDNAKIKSPHGLRQNSF